jgi:CelD/BcsL family acetyltransferase involved in cellulose biosynthesis
VLQCLEPITVIDSGQQRRAARHRATEAKLLHQMEQGGRGDLHVAVATTRDEIRLVMPAWRKLLEGAPTGSNVHNDPRMILLTLERDPTLTPLIVLLWRSGSLACVAPFYRQSLRFAFEFSVWRLPSIPACALRVFGESVVLDSDATSEPSVRAIGAVLREHRASYDFLQVYALNYSDRFWRAAMLNGGLAREAGLKSVAMRPEKIHEVRLRKSFEEYLASLNPRTRQTLRYGSRRFFRDPSARMEKCSRPTDVARLLQCVDKVYAQSWQAKAFGNARKDAVDYRRFLEQTAVEGWLRSYVLFHGEEPVAYQIGYQYNRMYYLQECAYSQQIAALSPGSVLTFSIMKDLHADGAVDVWDFGFGDLPYKRSLHGVQHEAATVYLIPPNRWRRILGLQIALNSAYDRVRNGLIRVGMDRLVRKLVKRQE